MSRNLPDDLEEDVAEYIARAAARLKRVCDAMGMASLSAALLLVIAEAERIASGAFKDTLSKQ
jgi:hypothetical protein